MSSEAGKGSDRRPGEGYQDGWERIWGNGNSDLWKCPNCGDPVPKGYDRLAHCKTLQSADTKGFNQTEGENK